MSESVIVAAKRTPIGAFLGALSTVTAPQLAASVIRDLLAVTGLPNHEIEEVILGQVVSAGTGQSPARQALIFGGLSNKTSALTLNKVCGSGLKSVMLADQAIRCGDSQAIMAGGMENMSMIPHGLLMRSGLRLGAGSLEDLLIKDGLQDAYTQKHMGLIAEECARDYKITREQQDAYARDSYVRAQSALAQKRFADEITPVSITDKKGNTTTITEDENPLRGDLAKLGHLKPAFASTGSITAGNASSLADGAAVLLLTSDTFAKTKGLKPLVRIVASATASQAPEWFTTAPALAIKQVLQKARLTVADIGLWEINEAFAVVNLYQNHKLSLPAERCNVNGGAVALGHPIGASGARILVTLIHEMHKRPDVRYGVAALCIGGGEAVAMIVEKIR